jgi:uncharacterized protein
VPYAAKMTQIHLLYQLQQIDDDLRSGKRRLQEVLQALQGSEALQQAQRQQEKAAAALQQARRQQKEQELEVGSLVSKLQRSEERLYSGRLHNPKELSDLEHEVASLTRRRGGLEDELLDLMVAVEEAEEAEARAVERLQAEEERWEARREALSAERDRLHAHLTQQLAAREELVGRLDRAALGAYENTARRRAGIAVALLHDELCQACGVRVSGTVLRGARAGELVYCGSCARILLLR